MGLLNELNRVEIKILDKRIIKLPCCSIPTYGTDGSAGLDLPAMFTHPHSKSIDLWIEPGETVLIPTGISVHVKDTGYAAVLLPRSGMGHKQGLVLGNLVGLIDSDYQGPLMVSLWNRSKERRVITLGQKIAQMIFIPVARPELVVVEEYDAVTQRGEGGFGHTGK